MEGKIIVIDGVSNSGKTTLCSNLILDENNVLVEEAPNFIRNHPELFNGQILPPIPKNAEEEINAQKFLLEVEIERLKQAYYIIKCGKNAILDRSFLSTVSIAYSFDDNNKFKGVYSHCVKLFREYLNFIYNLDINEHFQYIFLVAHPNTIKKRNQTREKILSSDWIDEKLMNLQNNFFIRQKENCNAKIINTTNLNREEVVKEIKNIEGEKLK